MSKLLFDRFVSMHLNSVDKDGSGHVDEQEFLELYRNLVVEDVLKKN